MTEIATSAMSSRVAIIGTGDFARAMSVRLLQRGYDVTLYSRYPQRRQATLRLDEQLAKVNVASLNSCFDNYNFVIVAVPHYAYATLDILSDNLTGHVVIDVSNPTTVAANGKSSAEILQNILPKSRVIKAFNSVSSYTLQSDVSGESRTVIVCGDDVTSRQSVVQLARELGFSAVEGGSLRQARHVEREQSQVCADWVRPMIVFTVLVILWTIYATLRYYVIRKVYDLARFPTNLTNKVFGCVSLTLLALTYLPGSLAAIIQLSRGTKYSRFPSWLDAWMKMRKQLGLLALFMGGIHMLMSIVLLNSAYISSWYITKIVVVKANDTADTAVAQDVRMNLNGELCVFFGMLGAAFMVIPGIASIPAVGSLLNWREWKLVQTVIGLTALIFSTTHVTIKGAYDWVKPTTSFFSMVQSMTFISSFLPWVCIALVLILWIPCFYLRLKRIRAGWEYGLPAEWHEDDVKDTKQYLSTSVSADTPPPSYDVTVIGRTTTTPL